MEEKKYKAMYKYEIAQKAGVSVRTLNRWLNSNIEDLRKLDYDKRTHLLNPKIVKYICEKFVIE